MADLDLNLILAHACPAQTTDYPVVNVFHIDVHCVRFIIRARLLSILPTITYEVIDFTTEGI